MSKQYDSIREAIKDLKKRGFVNDFCIDRNKLCSSRTESKFNPDEFKIVEAYRFDGMANNFESSVIYAIESAKHALKGYLISAYGMYTDYHTTLPAKKFELEHQHVA